MSVQTAHKPASLNPQTIDEARTFVKHVESLFMPWNVEGIVAGFTEDCVVRFGDLAEFRGRVELEKFFRARAERQKGYRLRKELKALMGDTIANTWEGEWEDSRSGAKMSGRGVEIWAMRGGRIAVWEAAFNFKEAGKTSAMGLLE
jgi:nuclear transport factor 2 (NTF2) superfamily protein